MKVSIASLLLGVDSTSISKRDVQKFQDLKGMATRLFEHHGEIWDETKFFGYGCHCLVPSDEFEEGKGLPVDQLDTICKHYRLCQKCVRNKQGDKCVTSDHKYNWRWNFHKKILEILSAPGSCERELGECDRLFVYDMFKQRNEYKQIFSYNYGKFDRKDNRNCPVIGKGNLASRRGSVGAEDEEVSSNFECCGGHNSPWLLFNKTKQQCCPLGNTAIIRPLSDKC